MQNNNAGLQGPKCSFVVKIHQFLAAGFLCASLGVAAQEPTTERPIENRSTAVVLDFENGTAGILRKSVRKELASRFLDRLEEQQAFDHVLNEKQAGKTKRANTDSAVVVAGVITHYRERTANIRILVGVEQGISFFDTRIKLNPKSGSDGLRADVNEITMVEDTVVNKVRDKGESVKEYVEDAAQLIARAYRTEHRQDRKS